MGQDQVTSDVQFELTRLIDELPGLVWTAMPDGSIDFVSRRWSEYTGSSGEEVRRGGWETIVHPEDLPELLDRSDSIRASGSPGEMEARLRRSDGEYRWFLIRLSPLTDLAGYVLKWFGLGIDIDDRKRAEKDLIESNFRQIVESVPVPVAVTSPTGEVIALNQATLRYFDRTFEELKGWKNSDMVHADDLPRTIAAQRAAHETGSAYNVESRHRRADGTYRWFNVIGLPLRDIDGRILRWFHLQIDIDDRKKAEEALRASERDLNQVINTIPTLAWSARADGSAEFLNQHYLDFIGLSPYEAKDWDWSRAVHPDDLESLSATWRRIMASGQPGEAEARLRRRDGEYRWFLFRVHPLRDESGRIVKWYGQNTDIEDRKRSEFLLRESERQFKTIFDEAGTGITMVDLAVGEPIRNNRALQKMLGCSEEELSRFETYDSLTYEPNREKDSETFRELTDGKRDSLRIEKHFVLKDGSSIWANVIFTLLRDDGGSPRYIIAIHEDITERKLALERLQANQDLLDLAQKSAGAMAFDWHIQDDLNHWSVEQEALYGMPPGGFDGTYQGWKKLIDPRDWPSVVDAIHHAQETGQVMAEFRVVWPDGSVHWLATNGQMFFDGEGNPLRMVGFTSDITGRKVVEEELRRSEAFLAEGQHLARVGNFTWRVATGEIVWSEQLYRIFEFEAGVPMTLERIATRVHPDDMPSLTDMVERAQRGANDFEYEHRLLTPDGAVKHLHLIAHRTRDERGGPEYIGAVQDVTQRRLAEEALSKARSELAMAARSMSLGVLTASIAHEVSQPLSGIITNASTCVRMLDADPPNVDGARETAKRTIRDGNRASEVITRLRALFGKKESTVESVDLNEAAQEVIALSWSELQRSQVVLQTRLAQNLPRVEGDRVQLQQVILNLLLNGAEAMSDVDDRQRLLTIHTEWEGNEKILLSVRDVGKGFTPEEAEKLFDAFFTTKKSGMGIGLSVSRSIIERHKGKFWAAPNEGPGSVFSFTIPVADTHRDNQE